MFVCRCLDVLVYGIFAERADVVFEGQAIVSEELCCIPRRFSCGGDVVYGREWFRAGLDVMIDFDDAWVGTWSIFDVEVVVWLQCAQYMEGIYESIISIAVCAGMVNASGECVYDVHAVGFVNECKGC